MDNCIFCKIVKKEIPTEIVYENDQVLVFPDIHPQSKRHLLIIPKQHIDEFVKADDIGLFGVLFHTASEILRKENLGDKQYKIVVNGGGAQDIDHLHVHLIAGLT